MNKFMTLLVAIAVAGTAVAQNSITATASIKPAKPATGENRLELDFMEGKNPVKGLKLVATVAMTSMDMGTAHPPVKEYAPGRYVLRPDFQMGGPWRVHLTSAKPSFQLDFDFNAGGDQVWKPQTKTIPIESAAAPAEPQKTTPTTVSPTAPTTTAQPPAQDKTVAQPKEMTMTGPSYSGQDMTAMNPTLVEKSTYTWAEGMDYGVRTGFGKLAPMVNMMMQMMVGGSGAEGMKMAPMTMSFDKANFTDDQSGDGSAAGNSDPSVNAKTYKVVATLDKPSVGDNQVEVMVQDTSGRPIDKAQIVATVAMTSMDMGTTHPKVVDQGAGKYSVGVKFAMAGPWRLTLAITVAGKPSEIYTFDYIVQ